MPSSKIIVNFKHGKPVSTMLLIVHVHYVVQCRSVSPIFFKIINVIHAYRFREEEGSYYIENRIH